MTISIWCGTSTNYGSQILMFVRVSWPSIKRRRHVGSKRQSILTKISAMHPTSRSPFSTSKGLMSAKSMRIAIYTGLKSWLLRARSCGF
jgi:hypothetical protein